VPSPDLSSRVGNCARTAPRVVVIGGGISGLTAALRLTEALGSGQVTLLEAADRIGGKLRVSEVAGVPVDEGADSMLNRRPEAVRLAAEVGLSADLVHPAATAAGLWTRGQIRPLPPSVLGIPTDLGALRRSGVVSVRGLARVQLERVLPGVHLEHDRSVGDLVTRRFGHEVTDLLVEPLLGGVYAGHADELSALACLAPLVPLLADHRSLTAAAQAVASGGDEPAAGERRPLFTGIVGGVGRLAEALARQLGHQVRTESTVRELSRLPDGGWRLAVGPSRSVELIEADALVLALPAVPAGRLLMDVAPRASLELGRIEYASVALVTLAVPSAAFPEPPIRSGFLVPPVEGKFVKAATYMSNKWGWVAASTGDTVIVRCSVGRHREEAALQRSDTELVDAVMADLAGATGLSGPLEDARVTRWGGALPQYAVGHQARVRRVHDEVGSIPGLAVCGAAYDGLGIAACVASAERAATRILTELASPTQ
jgi:protoporphyrinogen/coproporphyrinogen III oxidase